MVVPSVAVSIGNNWGCAGGGNSTAGIGESSGFDVANIIAASVCSSPFAALYPECAPAFLFAI